MRSDSSAPAAPLPQSQTDPAGHPHPCSEQGMTNSCQRGRKAACSITAYLQHLCSVPWDGLCHPASFICTGSIKAVTNDRAFPSQLSRWPQVTQPARVRPYLPCWVMGLARSDSLGR